PIRSRPPDDRDGGAARRLAVARGLETDDVPAEARHVDPETGLPQRLPGVLHGEAHDVRHRDVLLLAVLAAALDGTGVDQAVPLVHDDRDLVAAGHGGALGRGLLDHRVRFPAVDLLLA